MDNTWQQKIEYLLDRRADAAAAGGEARVEKQHAAGKLTARERMEALFDDGTFTELNDMIESRATDFGMEKKEKGINVRMWELLEKTGMSARLFNEVPAKIDESPLRFDSVDEKLAALRTDSLLFLQRNLEAAYRQKTESDDGR